MKINSKKVVNEIKRRGLRQYQVAALAGLTPQCISILLKRETSRLSTINQIAKVLDVDAKDLMI